MNESMDKTMKEDDLEPLKLGPFSCKQILTVLISWLIIYGLGTVFISNPFWTERHAGGNVNYIHAMYLHGLLIGLVGLVALTITQVFSFRSKHVRQSILGGMVLATILATVGGIFNKSITEIGWLWMQVFSFFVTDEIVLALLIGFYVEWRNKSGASRSFPFLSAWLSTLGAFIAAVMGHIAGYILEFGDHPRFIGLYAAAVGEKLDDLTGNMIISHAHLFTTSLLGLLVAAAAWRFGYKALEGGARNLARVGFVLLMAGTVGLIVIYASTAFTSFSWPTVFPFGPNGVNGFGADDFTDGFGLMLGGLIILLAMAFNRKPDFVAKWFRPTMTGVVATWVAVVLWGPVAGFSIQLRENLFGAGDPSAPLAKVDAAFVHSVIDFFPFMAAVLVLLLIADLFLGPDKVKTIGRWVGVGSLVTVAGLLVHVFNDAGAVFGPGYFLTGAGLAIIAVMAVLLVLRLGEAAGAEEMEKPPQGSHKGTAHPART